MNIHFLQNFELWLVGLGVVPGHLTSKDQISVFDAEYAQYWANIEARWWDEVVRWRPHQPTADKDPSDHIPAVVMQ